MGEELDTAHGIRRRNAADRAPTAVAVCQQFSRAVVAMNACMPQHAPPTPALTLLTPAHTNFFTAVRHVMATLIDPLLICLLKAVGSTT